MSKWTSCRQGFCENVEIDGKEFEVEGTVYGSYYYDPGCDYLSNGDPGYPPESELEITDIEIESCGWYNDNGEYIEATDEEYNKAQKYLDSLDADEFGDDWEFDEPDDCREE